MEEPGGLQSMGSRRVRHDWATSLSLFTFMHWRRKWQPTPVFLPGESQGQRSLVGCCLRDHTELDTTEGIAAAAVSIPISVGRVMSLLFNTLSRFDSFPSKEQASFNFMDTVTICNDYGAQENKICHCFYFSPLYLPWNEGTRCHDLRFLNVEF